MGYTGPEKAVPLAAKEAKARIKINKLLEESGWRFFDITEGKANILLENNVKLTETKFNEFGADFEKTKNGFIDFLLLDNQGYPFVVLEAKAEIRTLFSAKSRPAAMPLPSIAGLSSFPTGTATIFGIWNAATLAS
jgi:type I restriction enzyme R subunit